jgi:hypothetical protein
MYSDAENLDRSARHSGLCWANSLVIADRSHWQTVAIPQRPTIVQAVQDLRSADCRRSILELREVGSNNVREVAIDLIYRAISQGDELPHNLVVPRSPPPAAFAYRDWLQLAQRQGSRDCLPTKSCPRRRDHWPRTAVGCINDAVVPARTTASGPLTESVSIPRHGGIYRWRCAVIGS